jgi:hypothetical protein
VTHVVETTFKPEAASQELVLHLAVKDEYVITAFSMINYEIIGAATALALPVQFVAYELVFVLNTVGRLLLSDEKPDLMTITDRENAVVNCCILNSE